MKPKPNTSSPAPSSIEDLESQLAKARAELVTAEAAKADRQSQFDEGLARDDRAAVQRAKAARDEAELDREMAAARVGRLEREIVEAREGEQQRVRVEAYSAALALRDVSVNRLMAEYEKAAFAIVAMVDDLTKADQAIRRVNRDLPEGFDPIEFAESFARVSPGAPRKVVSTETVEKWVFEGSGQMVGDAPAYPILPNNDGATGFMRGPSNSIPVRRKRFKKTVFIPGGRAALPAPFEETLRLPALLGGRPDLFPDFEGLRRERLGLGVAPQSDESGSAEPHETLYEPI